MNRNQIVYSVIYNRGNSLFWAIRIQTEIWMNQSVQWNLTHDSVGKGLNVHVKRHQQIEISSIFKVHIVYCVEFFKVLDIQNH